MNSKPMILNTRKGKSNPPDIRVRKKSKLDGQASATIFNIVTNIIIILLITLGIYSAYKVFTHDKKSMLGPEILGFRSTMIVTDSMYPKIKSGALIITKKIPYDKYKIGDVVTYVVFRETSEVKEVAENEENAAGSAVTHRIIDIVQQDGERMFITKGDNSQSPDNPISEERMEGKVIFHLNSAAGIINFIKTPTGMMVAGAILIFILFVVPLFGKKEEK